MPELGDILCDKKFKFGDGTVGEKLLIILNKPRGNEPYLVVKTTSQKDRYEGVKPGCNPKRHVFLFAGFRKRRFSQGYIYSAE